MVVRKFIKKFIKRSPSVGLALGSGGAAGFAHIGVIKVLEENEIPIKYISGCSAGAIVGAYYALKGEVYSLEEKINSMTKRELLRLFGFSKPTLSLISDTNLELFLKDLFDGKSFSDTKIPLRITSVDLEKGEEFVFDEGKIIDAVMASISIPGFFPVKKYKKRVLVDGGVLNPVPISLLEDLKADLIIACDLNRSRKIKMSSFGSINVFRKSVEIMMDEINFLKNSNLDNVIFIKPSTKGDINSLGIFNSKKYIKYGEKATKDKIEGIKFWIKDYKRIGNLDKLKKLNLFD